MGMVQRVLLMLRLKVKRRVKLGTQESSRLLQPRPTGTKRRPGKQQLLRRRKLRNSAKPKARPIRPTKKARLPNPKRSKWQRKQMRPRKKAKPYPVHVPNSVKPGEAVGGVNKLLAPWAENSTRIICSLHPQKSSAPWAQWVSSIEVRLSDHRVEISVRRCLQSSSSEFRLQGPYTLAGRAEGR